MNTFIISNIISKQHTEHSRKRPSIVASSITYILPVLFKWTVIVVACQAAGPLT